MLYVQIAREFPDAKFLIVRRAVADWIVSVRRVVPGHFNLERIFYSSICGRETGSTELYSSDDLAAGYNAFVDSAVAYLGDRLTVFDLYDPELGAKLASWLGVQKRFELGHVL